MVVTKSASMILSAHSGVTWGSAIQANTATSLSSCSSCSSSVSFTRAGHSPHGSCTSSSTPPLSLPTCGFCQRNSPRIYSAKDSSDRNSKSVYCSSSNSSMMLTSSPKSGLPPPQYHHQNRIIELPRLRVKVQNGGVRLWTNAKAQDGSDDDARSTTEAQLTIPQTRRNILIRSSAAVGVAVANLCSGRGKDCAEASVSQRVRLKDVDNQKLQDALRAAVAGDLENAETLFTELIKEEPESASGWSNRGSVRISLGKYEQATDDFTKAIELAPQAPVPFLNRAISYEALGRFDEAIADCKTAIENDPEEPAAWFNLGNVDARVKDFDSALVAYQRASVLAPGIAGYRFRQALVLFQIGRMVEAKKLLQGLVRKYPNYTEAHAALAALLWGEGQRSNAEEQFSIATNSEPLYGRISWVETELQWPPGVVEAFAKFLSIDYTKS